MANNTKEFDLISLLLRKKYRNQMEIIASILEAAEGDGAALYALMKRADMNYVQLKKYLPPLTKIGFIETEVKDGRISFRASKRGTAFLRQYKILQNMLLSAYIDNKPFNAIEEESKLSKVQQRVTIPFSARIIKRK